jgi:hypothetical protein
MGAIGAMPPQTAAEKICGHKLSKMHFLLHNVAQTALALKLRTPSPSRLDVAAKQSHARHSLRTRLERTYASATAPACAQACAPACAVAARSRLTECTCAHLPCTMSAVAVLLKLSTNLLKI